MAVSATDASYKRIRRAQGVPIVWREMCHTADIR